MNNFKSIDTNQLTQTLDMQSVKKKYFSDQNMSEKLFDFSDYL